MAARGTGPVVLVTDAGKGSALAFIRSLGAAGYTVIAADAERSSLGFRSRYAHACELYPAPAHDPNGFVEAVLRIVRARGVALVVPVTDWTIRPLAARRPELEAETRLAIAEDDALSVVMDKTETLRLAERLGVPVPRTRIVHSVDQALAAAPELGWPLVLKPQSSVDGRGDDKLEVTYAASVDELARRMRPFEGRLAVLLQRYLRGTGAGVSLLASAGRPLAAFEHRRLHEVPLTGGASSYRESAALDPVRYAYAARLLEALRFTGLAMVEFKVAPERTELMEINGRVWGSLPLALASGVDFPVLLTRLYLEGEAAVGPFAPGRYRVGVRCRHLGTDLLWMAQTLVQRRRHPALAIPSRAELLPALAGLFNPKNKLDVQCLDDPWPGLVELPRIVRRLWSKGRHARADGARSAPATVL